MTQQLPVINAKVDVEKGEDGELVLTIQIQTCHVSQAIL